MTAPSNIAVDHLAERISQTGLRVVRVQARGLWTAAPRHSVPGPAALCPVVLCRAVPSPALPRPAVSILRTKGSSHLPALARSTARPCGMPHFAQRRRLPSAAPEPSSGPPTPPSPTQPHLQARSREAVATTVEHLTLHYQVCAPPSVRLSAICPCWPPLLPGQMPGRAFSWSPARQQGARRGVAACLPAADPAWPRLLASRPAGNPAVTESHPNPSRSHNHRLSTWTSLRRWSCAS